MLVGFSGALIVIRPSFQEVGWPALLPVGAAVCFAFYIVLTRRAATHEEPAQMQFLSAIWLWVYHALAGDRRLGRDSGYDAGLADDHRMGWFIRPGCHRNHRPHVSGVRAQVCQRVGACTFSIPGTRQRDPSRLVVFADFPDAATLTGAAIIVSSGLYVFHRERVLGA